MRSAIRCSGCGTELVYDTDWVRDGVLCVRCGALIVRPNGPPALPPNLTPPPLSRFDAAPTKPDFDSFLHSKSLAISAAVLASGLVISALIVAIVLALTGGRSMTSVDSTGPEAKPTIVAPEVTPVTVQKPVVEAPVEVAAPEATTPVVVEDEPKDDPQARLIERVEKSVVTVRCNNGALGSGFFINDQGRLVTNYHVIALAQDGALVELWDGRTFTVQGFSYVSRWRDLAILEIDCPPKVVEPLELRAEFPEKGERVYALGAPHGLTGSVAEGIVSAIRDGRSVVQALIADGMRKEFIVIGDDPRMNWVQTTAPVDHGNSGGPLVDKQGKVVGINTLKTGNNLNFSVSATEVIKLLDSLPTRPSSLVALPSLSHTERLLLDPRYREKVLRGMEEDAERKRQQAVTDFENRRAAETRQIEDRIAREAELTRTNDRMAIVRAQISVIEAEGTALTAEHGKVQAQGQAARVRHSQLLQQAAAIRARLDFIGGAIQRRQTAMSSKFAPIFLDGDRATYDANGVLALQLEASALNGQLSSVVAEGQTLEALYSGLDVKARQLQGQIQYKLSAKNLLIAEMVQLDAKYQELSGGAANPLLEQFRRK